MPSLTSRVWLFLILQDLLSMGFSRQEYWSGLPCPLLGDLSNPGIQLTSLASPALAVAFFTPFVVVLLSHVWLFVTPWAAECQAFLFFTISWSLFKPMSIESVMPSNHLILCSPLLLLPSSFPASGSFLMRWVFTSGGQRIGASASASVLPKNVQGWFPLGLTGLISLQSKGLSL